MTRRGARRIHARAKGEYVIGCDTAVSDPDTGDWSEVDCQLCRYVIEGLGAHMWHHAFLEQGFMGNARDAAVFEAWAEQHPEWPRVRPEAFELVGSRTLRCPRCAAGFDIDGRTLADAFAAVSDHFCPDQGADRQAIHPRLRAL